ncbi:MAG: hypothetical protein QXE81_02230 [Desulfurococcaceae archaeon]
MTEHYLRIIREEMRNTSLSQIPFQRLDSIIQTIKKSYIGVLGLSPIGRELFTTMLSKTINDVNLLAKIRLAKTILLESAESSSVDLSIGKALLSLLKANNTLLSPIVIRYGERILYKFKSDCFIGSKMFREREIAPVSIDEMIKAEINSCGEPLVDPVYRYFATNVLK